MGWGDDFGSFEADMEAAAERESDAEQDEAMAEALEAFGGIGTGRPGPGFNREDGFLERSTTAQGGIGSGRPGPGFDFADDVGSGLLGGRTDREGSEGYYDANPYGGGLLDGTNRSGFTGGGMMDYSDMTGLTEADLSEKWGIGAGQRDAGYNYSGDMNLAMAHAYDQRFSEQPNHPWNQLTEEEKRSIVTREQAGPSWLADKFNISLDTRLDNLIDSEIGDRVDEEGTPGWDRDDTVAEDACVASGGTWDGGQCIMPSVDPDDDDDNGDDDGGYDPFASLTRERKMFYHPMLETTPYSGERPDYVDENIWDYKPPQLRNWAGGLRKWASGD